MISLNTLQTEIYNEILNLKMESGSHSPSLSMIKSRVSNLHIKIDACFLSNPYATDLFINKLKEELLDKNFLLRDILEYYPSQNKSIANGLSKILNVPSNQIFIGNGAIEIIQAIVQKFVKKKILINIPTFSSYYEFVNDGVEVIYNKLNKEDNFCLDTNAFLKKCEMEKPDTIVLINPNNPDGGYLSTDTLIKLLDNLKFVDNIILDESFIHFALGRNEYEIVDNSFLVNKYSNLIIIKSMSKDFGIAGIRVGYSIMQEDKVNKLLKNGYLWNSNGLAEYFLNLYLKNDFQKNYLEERKKYMEGTSQLFQLLLQNKNIKVYPSSANFFLIEILNSYTSDQFAFTLLAKEGIYTRTCSDKLGLQEGNYIRLSSRRINENKIIASAIENMFK